MHRSVLRGIALILALAVALAVMLLLPGKKPPVKHAENMDPWLLVSYSPDTQYGTYLGNGLISTRIKGDGVGSQDGKPLPCFMAGLYDDEKLVPTPTWSDFRFYEGSNEHGVRCKLDSSQDYKQTLDMRTGILTTQGTWRAEGRTLKGTIEVVVSRSQPNAAMLRVTMTPDFDGDIRVEVPLTVTSDRLLQRQATHLGDGMSYSYQTKQSGIWIHIISRLSSDLPSKMTSVLASYRVRRDHKFTILKSVAVASGPNQAAAESAARSAQISDWSSFVAKHKAAWAKLWQSDITIKGSPKDQQVIHSCMFYLLESVREGSQWSIPPMGLSDNGYSGHIFWDADIWMFPALILQHPELARAIIDYRYNTLPGALANAKADGFLGAEYAWESGYTGREDIQPGLVYKQERHIDGDVALAQWQYYLATSDTTWLRERGYPVIKATADYWVSRAKLSAANGKYEILQVVPPDENADLVNNSAYTNAIAKLNLEIATHAARIAGCPADPRWTEVAAKMYVPFDSVNKRFLEFDGYKGLQTKQADTELLIYPLQYNMDAKDLTGIYRNTFLFYAPKVFKNGPAMTSSAHSVIAARLDDCPRAYKDFVKSYKPYLRGPFNYFNEKASRTSESMCFLTGAAGPVQAVLFGLAGARMDYFPQDAKTSALKYSPCLPKAWKSLKITGVKWRGQSFDVNVSGGGKVTLATSMPAGRAGR